MEERPDFEDEIKEMHSVATTILYVFLALLMVVVITIAILIMPRKANADCINMSAIATIESNNNPKAVGKFGEVGLYQITAICLADYNAHHSVKYSRNDLFSPQVNYTVARWYLTVRCPQFIAMYGKPLTVKNIIWCYNAGHRNFARNRKPPFTKRYLLRYAKLTKGAR